MLNYAEYDDDDLLKDDRLFDEIPYDHPEFERDIGSGTLRIGKIFQPNMEADLYTFIFVTSFHPEYVYACQ